jgi:hypothetical protein
MSTYYRAQAQRCLALSRAAHGKQRVQLLLMANRYLERAEELEQAVRSQTRHHNYEGMRIA